MEPKRLLLYSQDSFIFPQFEPDKSTPWPSIIFFEININISHQCLVLSSDFFPSGFHVKTLLTFLFSSTRITFRNSRPAQFNHPSKKWLRVKIIPQTITQLSVASCYFSPFRLIYLPWNFDLKNYYLASVPYTEKPSFTKTLVGHKINLLKPSDFYTYHQV